MAYHSSGKTTRIWTPIFVFFVFGAVSLWGWKGIELSFPISMMLAFLFSSQILAVFSWMNRYTLEFVTEVDFEREACEREFHWRSLRIAGSVSYVLIGSAIGFFLALFLNFFFATVFLGCVTIFLSLSIIFWSLDTKRMVCGLKT